MRLRECLTINEAGHLCVGGCDTVALAAEYGTPLVVMDEAYIREQCKRLRGAMQTHWPNGRVVYASKPFCTIAMCKLIAEEGLYMDVVSAGELDTALAAGFDPQHLEFHGNNKTPYELRMAIEAGVHRVIIDGRSEIAPLAEEARRQGKRVQVLLRLNPGIDADTHRYIQTATTDSKFGESIATGSALRAVREICAREELELCGVHFHIGSQLSDMRGLIKGCQAMVAFMRAVYDETGVWLREANLGGGFGVVYTEKDHPVPIEDAVRTLAEALGGACDALGVPRPVMIIEPGRVVVAEAGIALYTVGAIKEIEGVRKYVSVDGGLMDNPRPLLYQAEYRCALANRMRDPETETVAIAGKCCETDILIWETPLAHAARGDILAMFTCGAYQYAMASNYHRTPKPEVIFVRDGKHASVVKRQTYAQMRENDRVPTWMA